MSKAVASGLLSVEWSAQETFEHLRGYYPIRKFLCLARKVRLARLEQEDLGVSIEEIRNKLLSDPQLDEDVKETLVREHDTKMERCKVCWISAETTEAKMLQLRAKNPWIDYYLAICELLKKVNTQTG